MNYLSDTFILTFVSRKPLTFYYPTKLVTRRWWADFIGNGTNPTTKNKGKFILNGVYDNFATITLIILSILLNIFHSIID